MHHKETLETRKREKEQREEESLEKSRAALLEQRFVLRRVFLILAVFLFLNLSLSYSLETLVYTSAGRI